LNFIEDDSPIWPGGSSCLQAENTSLQRTASEKQVNQKRNIISLKNTKSSLLHLTTANILKQN